MVSLRIERVLDESMARVWHGVHEVVTPAEHPGLLADPLQELLAFLSDGTASERREYYVGFDGETPVAAVSMTMPIRDNTHAAHVDVQVLRERRRRGLGRQMLVPVMESARAMGRSMITGFIGPRDEGFGVALGARKVHGSIRYELAFGSVHRGHISELAEQARREAAGYELVAWIDEAPEEYIDDFARLSGRMATDSPRGEADWQPEIWDADRSREVEREVRARGRTRVVTGAVHVESRRLVASTDITVSRQRPVIAYQWDTIVDPDHRGHRLGMLIKAANLDLLEASVPGVERVETWNATDNTYMIGINEAMGFKAIETETWWELDL